MERKKRLFVNVPLLLLISMPMLIQVSVSAPEFKGPYLDELRVIKIVDPSAAYAALLAGEVDVVDVTTKADAETLAESGFKMVPYSPFPPWCLQSAHFNMDPDNGPITDLDFRRAITHLIPKEDILEDLFGPLGEYTHGYIPHSVGSEWYNDQVPDYTTYDPELAALMLDQAGYTMGGDGKRIDPATDETIRTLKLVAVTEHGANNGAFTERWADELNSVGIPATYEYTPLAGGAWYNKVMIERDFDTFVIPPCTGSTPNPTGFIIFEYLSPGKEGSFNICGYSSPEVDEQIQLMQQTADREEAAEACYRIQELVAEDLPLVPLYVIVYPSAVNPELMTFGFIPVYTMSCNAMLRMQFRSGPGGTAVLRTHQEPSSFVHGLDPNGIVFTYTILTCDRPCDFNQFTNELMPWVVKDWIVEPYEAPNILNGLKISVEVHEGLYWHDGVEFTIDDMVFGANYAKDHSLTNMDSLLSYMEGQVTGENTAEFYLNSTTVFTVFDFLADATILSFPKHIYNYNATKYGEPLGPVGLQVEGEPGVPDPLTFAAALVPHPNPPEDKPWLTCLIGVGPWILRSFEWGVGPVFVANRNYHKYILFTDANFDGRVDILDIASAATAFGTSLGDPRWQVMVDLDGNDEINILDLATIAIDFGSTY